MKMAKRKGDKLTLDEVEDMIEKGVLSVDEESECSEDEDFEPVSSNLPSSLRVQRNQAMTVLMKTMNRTQKSLIGLVAMAHIGDRIPLLQVGPQGIILCMNSQALNGL